MSEPLTLRSTLTLNDGRAIPRLGLGVFQSPRGEETRAAVLAALRAGYRHIDTARVYMNESDVGEAIRESGVPREEIWVTTKLWNDDHGYDAALAAFEASRKRLGLEYVDLYLLHWPVPRLRLESWRALETLRADGRARSIGVSNFMVRHLDELLAHAKTVPAVNQIELSPFLRQDDVVARCAKAGIALEAYSPLTKGARLDESHVVATAKKLGRSPAQVLIRWSLQKGFVVIPKSTREERIRENAAVFDFEIPAADMSALDGLDEGLHTGWDPTDAP
ncbi:MAG TPA: aldo/keto reductase [bacterium]|nr:aldo/keto reductase [bacterium]